MEVIDIGFHMFRSENDGKKFRQPHVGIERERERDYFLVENRLNPQIISSFLHFGSIIEKKGP